MQSVTAVGTKIATRIRQAGFDPLDVEALMYMGEQTVPMFTHALKRSTWAQIYWSYLPSQGGERCQDFVFNVTGIGSTSVNAMDYLLAIGIEATFPKITLVNTPAPVPFVTSFLPAGVTDVTPAEVISASGATPLFFYLSDGTAGLPAGQVFVGTFAALTTSRASGGLGISPSLVLPFVSYSPRHRVGWGDHAVIGAVENLVFAIDGVEYEDLRRHALYNALQFRMREDVYPIAGHEATSLPAVLLPAGIGSGDEVVLGLCEDDRYRAFIAPFSFTDSALTDRGENGKQKSAFPAMLACKNLTQVRLTTIDDPRSLLILEEEVLPDYAAQSVIFVATPTELAIDPVTGLPTFTPFITNGTTVFSIPSGFIGSSGTTGFFSTSGEFVVSTDGVSMTFSTTSPFRVGDFGVLFLEQTGEYLPLTRPPCYSLDNPFSREFDYRCWIEENEHKICFRANALGAIVTDVERGMMKADCRSKRWMYDRYTYFEKQGIRPGDKSTIDIDEVPGQTKYAYTFVQNEISRLQGHFFNYTNDTDYIVVEDQQIYQPRYVFNGRDSIERISTRIQGYKDEDHPAGFYRYVDNPLFAQRAPREHGLHIAPRYANWINSIYPDGSINGQFSDASITIKTTASGLLDLQVSPFWGRCNTYAYNFFVIVVAWNIVLFEILPCGNH